MELSILCAQIEEKRRELAAAVVRAKGSFLDPQVLAVSAHLNELITLWTALNR